MIRRLFALVFFLLIASTAGASIVTIPYTFVPYTQAQSSQVNANFSAVAGAINGNIDNTNIGGAGIYASQIIPTSSVSAIFGGAFNYSFPLSLNVGNAVYATGNVGSANGTFVCTSYSGCGSGIAQLCAINSGGTPQCLIITNVGAVTTLSYFQSNVGQFVANTGATASLCPNGSCGNALVVNAAGAVSIAGQMSAPGGYLGPGSYGVPYVYGDSTPNEKISRGSVVTNASGVAVTTLHFTSATTYTCTLGNQTSLVATQVVNNSGTQISVYANGTAQTVGYTCIGN